jgi:hypothetical protein
MKNAKMVLFAMLLSAPLSMFGMDTIEVRVSPVAPKVEHFEEMNRKTKEEIALSKFSNKAMTAEELNHASLGNQSAFSVTAMLDTIREEHQATRQKDFRNYGLASVLSVLTLGVSIATQKYAPCNATRDPKFVLGQAALAGSAVTTTVLALRAARQGYPEHTPVSLVSQLWKKADVKSVDEVEKK